MGALQEMVTWDQVLNKLRQAEMPPDQKQGVLDMIMKDAGNGASPSMNYFNRPPPSFTPSPTMPGAYQQEMPMRPGGQVVQDYNPSLTPRQAETSAELDAIMRDYRRK